jgi:hypothetical protein
VGTSTGGLLAVALGLRRMSVEQCTFIYKVLGQKVFSRVVPAAKGDAKEGWVEVRRAGGGLGARGARVAASQGLA